MAINSGSDDENDEEGECLLKYFDFGFIGKKKMSPPPRTVSSGERWSLGRRK